MAYTAPGQYYFLPSVLPHAFWPFNMEIWVNGIEFVVELLIPGFLPLVHDESVNFTFKILQSERQLCQRQLCQRNLVNTFWYTLQMRYQGSETGQQATGIYSGRCDSNPRTSDLITKCISLVIKRTQLAQYFNCGGNTRPFVLIYTSIYTSSHC